jgi:hypothetical protein
MTKVLVQYKGALPRPLGQYGAIGPPPPSTPPSVIFTHVRGCGVATAGGHLPPAPQSPSEQQRRLSGTVQTLPLHSFEPPTSQQ